MKIIIALFLMVIYSGLAVAQMPPGPESTIPGDITVDEGAFIEQIGNFHEATINQTGYHAGRIYQEGEGPEGNYARLTQVGDNHTGFISQVGDDNTGVINVEGIGNISVIVQEGDGHNVQFSMQGENNTADIRQFGTSDHLVGFAADDEHSIFQSGNNNQLFSVQIGGTDGHLLTTLDDRDYIQNGDGNLIDVWQEGSSHIARLYQDGDGHTIIVVQHGSENVTEIGQDGSGHWSFVTQNGNYNSATVNQSN
ncbi:MAG: hypothetical protein R6U28_08070 [Cyclonatronaceae bacterium]